MRTSSAFGVNNASANINHDAAPASVVLRFSKAAIGANDFLKNVVGLRGPDIGLGIFIMHGDVLLNSGSQFRNALEHTALQSIGRETVRYDWLAHHLFDSIDEVQDFATKWLWSYNHERPNMAIGGITPKQKLALAA